MKYFVALVAFALTPFTALSATFTFDVVVTESMDLNPPPAPSVPAFDLPDVGTTGTVTIKLFDTVFNGTNMLPIPGTDLSGLIEARADIGALTSELTEPSINPFATNSFDLANGTFSELRITTSVVPDSTALAGGFRFTPASGTPAPTTLDDIQAIFADPLTAVTFSFNGDINGEFVSFAASKPVGVPPVPLPAGGVLLVSGLAGLGLARWRSKNAQS